MPSRRVCFRVDQETLDRLIEATGAETLSEAIKTAIRFYLRVVERSCAEAVN